MCVCFKAVITGNILKMSFLKGLQPTPELGNFHFGKQTKISSRVNTPEVDPVNTKTNR